MSQIVGYLSAWLGISPLVCMLKDLLPGTEYNVNKDKETQKEERRHCKIGRQGRRKTTETRKSA